MASLHVSLYGRPVARAAVCLAGVGLASPALAGLPCLNPAIVTPAQGSRESSTRPMISWRAAAGVSSYRLQLVSREPEGRTLASIDSLVNDTRFLPPQALADGFALVSVRVTSLCPEGAPPASSPAREHRFLIDARSACAVSGLTLDSLDAGEKRIRWAPTPAAGGYETFGYEAIGGRLLFRLETSEPTVVTPAVIASPVLVAVRARCGEVFGQVGHLAY